MFRVEGYYSIIIQDRIDRKMENDMEVYFLMIPRRQSLSSGKHEQLPHRFCGSSRPPRYPEEKLVYHRFVLR